MTTVTRKRKFMNGCLVFELLVEAHIEHAKATGETLGLTAPLGRLLASTSDGRGFTCSIFEGSPLAGRGTMTIRRPDGVTVKGGFWMDFPERHWKIRRSAYDKLPIERRAQMEADEQALRYDLEKDFYWHSGVVGVMCAFCNSSLRDTVQRVADPVEQVVSFVRESLVRGHHPEYASWPARSMAAQVTALGLEVTVRAHEECARKCLCILGRRTLADGEWGVLWGDAVAEVLARPA